MSKYFDRHLLPGEDIVYRGKVSMVKTIPLIVITTVLTLMVIILCSMFFAPMITAGPIMGLIILLPLLFMAIKNLDRLLFSEFVITNKRCLLKRGLISVAMTDIMLDKCGGISCRKSGFGRILNYGTVSVSTSGMTQEYHGLASPYRFREQLSFAIENFNQR